MPKGSEGPDHSGRLRCVGSWAWSNGADGSRVAMALVGVIAIPGGPAEGSGGSVTGLSFNAVEGSAFAGNVALFVDPACAATYSATISWGDGQVSSGAITYNGTCAAGYNVVSSHTYAEEGIYQTSVSVSGTDGFSGTGTGTATVSDAAISLSPLTVTFTAERASRRTSRSCATPIPPVLRRTTNPRSTGATGTHRRVW